MKIVYGICKRRFGKVISPLKVVYSRLPVSFSFFSNKIGELDKKLSLDPALALMIRIHIAQVNSCHFCIDIAKAKAIQGFADTEKFYNVGEYLKSSLFTEGEKAALAFAEELTLTKNVSDATFARARNHFTERQMIEISWLVATEHYYNLINISFNLDSDNLCQLKRS